MKNLLLILVVIIASYVFFSPAVYAATVSQVKGSKLLIQLDGADMPADTEFYVTNAEGKKIGLAKIKAVKGDKAVADLLKGKAESGNGIVMKAAGASNTSNLTQNQNSSSDVKTDVKARDTRATTSKGKPKNTGGLLLGLANNTMSLTAQYGTTKENLTMKDSGFIVKGFYDYPLTKDFIARLGAGLQMFSVKGTTSASICNNGSSTSCEVGFTYLVGEAMAQYYLTDGGFKLWGGIGYHFLVAATKKNSVPNLASDTSTNQMISFGGGFDYYMSKSSFIPFSFLMGMFPGSSNVSASSTIIQAGYGFGF